MLMFLCKIWKEYHKTCFHYDISNFRGIKHLVCVDYNTVDSSPRVVIYLQLIVTLYAHFIYDEFLQRMCSIKLMQELFL